MKLKINKISTKKKLRIKIRLNWNTINKKSQTIIFKGEKENKRKRNGPPWKTKLSLPTCTASSRKRCGGHPMV
jgi:hypothetical protein